MFNARKVFKERLDVHVKETSRYLKYIFNGHIAVAMFFLVAALAYYYQQFLAQLPKDFPSAIIIGIVFGLDRKSTRLNSSHVAISYAVFCLKKNNTILTLYLYVLNLLQF